MCLCNINVCTAKGYLVRRLYTNLLNCLVVKNNFFFVFYLVWREIIIIISQKNGCFSYFRVVFNKKSLKYELNLLNFFFFFTEFYFYKIKIKFIEPKFKRIRVNILTVSECQVFKVKFTKFTVFQSNVKKLYSAMYHFSLWFFF